MFAPAAGGADDGQLARTGTCAVVTGHKVADESGSDRKRRNDGRAASETGAAVASYWPKSGR